MRPSWHEQTAPVSPPFPAEESGNFNILIVRNDQDRKAFDRGSKNPLMWILKIAQYLIFYPVAAMSSISAILLYIGWLFRSSNIVAKGGLVSTTLQRIQFIYAGWRHQDLLDPRAGARKTEPFHRRMKARPSMLDAVIRPYQSTNWNTRTRLTKLLAHYEAMVKLRWLFDPHEDREVTLCLLADVHLGLRLVLDEAIWFKDEGPMVISLFLDADRIFSIAFALREEDGGLVAHVGAVQGRSPRDLPGILERYRELTRAAHGMRPRDLLIELFRTLCASLAVSRILLVSDAYQQHRDPYFGQSRNDVRACYDDVWLERGAVRIDETMFELPLYANLRTPDQIPPRKRGLYRRRYDMLATISRRMTETLAHLAGRV